MSNDRDSQLGRGIILDYNVTDNTYTVDVEGNALVGCRSMSGVVASSFLGLNVHARLSVGTQVLVAFGSPHWIISSASMETADPASCHGRTMTGCGLKDAVQDIAGCVDEEPYDGSVPEDLYEGEHEITRMNGMFFRFLMGLVGLGANDRAKIEMLLHRELVRVVSRNFEHFSSFGDMKIYDDGRNNVEITGTTYEHERLGLVNPTDDKSPDPEEPPEFDPQATGRWRFKLLLGFMGDMLNVWFHDPQAAVGKMIDEQDQYCAGKFRAHIGHDGSFLIQSTGDIAWERVTRIPVPYRLKHEEDPKGVLRDEMEALDKQLTRVWNWKAGDKPHYVLFQIRDYCRYFSQFQSCARINQMAERGEWKVPSEDATPDPSMKEKDRNTPQLYISRYSTIRMMRDGSILTMDHYGNVTASGPYGIKHSSASDYEVTAARDIIFKAGRNMFISARRHMEIISHVGSLVVKARTGLRMLCERGTMWIKSDYKPDDPYTPEEGDPTVEVFDDQALRIESSEGKMWLQSHKSLRVYAGASGATGDALEFHAATGWSVRVAGLADIQVSSDFQIESSGSLKILASSLWSKIPGGVYIDNIATLRVGRSELRGLLVTSVTSAGSIQCLNGTVSDYNHDNSVPIVKPLPEDIVRVGPLLPPTVSFSWKLLTATEYAPFDELFESLTQQQLRLEELQELPEFEDAEFLSWPDMTNVLLAGRNTDSASAGWPGKSAKWMSYTAEYEALREPAVAPGSSFEPIDKTLTSETIQFKFLNK